jgi:hypothetical protein
MGALAFLSDFVDGVSGSLLLAVASSGASWGGLALFAGYSFMRLHPLLLPRLPCSSRRS